jgi:large subunit ribosomal protein L6
MKELTQTIEIVEGVKVTAEARRITAKGPAGEVQRTIADPRISVRVEGNNVEVKTAGSTKRELRKIRTWTSHIRNMIRGAAEGHTYKLKVCSGHFPMNVTASDKEFTVKNFLGEKVPRVLKLKHGTSVKVEGDLVTVESTSKELAGQTAADIEQLCRICGRDRRIFQDGLWIIEKDGKPIK